MSRRARILLGLLVALAAAGLWGRAALKAPLAPFHAEYAVFAPGSTGQVALEVTPLRMGSTVAPACALAGYASCRTLNTVVHAAYWVKHPRGTFLIDSGFSAHGPDDLARFGFVERQLLAFRFEQGLAQALAAAGKPAQVDFVLLTHGHWDHTSGLRDLHSPTVVLGPGEEAFMDGYRAQPWAGVRPDHLDGAQLQRFRWDGPPYENFPASHDWFGDGSVVLVPLPGHTPGSLGVFLNGVHGQRLFFLGDAAWAAEGALIPSHKSRPLFQLVDRDPEALSATLWRLHYLHAAHPDLLLIPTHDWRAFQQVQALNAGAP